MTTLSPDLLALLRRHLPAGTVIHTLSGGKPNEIVHVGADGVLIETERSQAQATGPQRVDAWMLEAAWERLATHGRLTNKELLDTDGLNVKRSSAVCAMLAHLPGVVVESERPIVLRWERP